MSIIILLWSIVFEYINLKWWREEANGCWWISIEQWCGANESGTIRHHCTEYSSRWTRFVLNLNHVHRRSRDRSSCLTTSWKLFPPLKYANAFINIDQVSLKNSHSSNIILTDNVLLHECYFFFFFASLNINFIYNFICN